MSHQDVYIVSTYHSVVRLRAYILDYMLVGDTKAEITIMFITGEVLARKLKINDKIMDKISEVTHKLNPAVKEMPSVFQNHLRPKSFIESSLGHIVNSVVYILSPIKADEVDSLNTYHYAQFVKENKDVQLVSVCDDFQPLKPRKLLTHPKTYDGFFTIGSLFHPLLRAKVICKSLVRESTLTYTNFLNGEPVKPTYQHRVSSGEITQPEFLKKSYNYLGHPIAVDQKTEDLMNGENEGAVRWVQAFELLATVPQIPPWLMHTRSDYMIGDDVKSQDFITSFSESLRRNKMHAIARYCKTPPGGKKKGTMNIVALIPKPHYLEVSLLPFKKDYNSNYKFSIIPEEPASDEVDLDSKMGELVDQMTNNEIIEPIRDQSMTRPLDYARKELYERFNILNEANPFGGVDMPDSGAPLPIPITSQKIKELSKDLHFNFDIQVPQQETKLGKRSGPENYLADEESQDLSSLI